MNVLKLVTSTDLDNKTIHINEQNKLEAVFTRYTLIGSGRPDKPETTDGVITGKEVDGMMFQSTNGAGVGAYLWQKVNGNWVCVSGDTGWVDLPTINLKGKSFIKIRRVNNQVYLSFGGIGWGLFGVLGTEEEGYKYIRSYPPRVHLTDFNMIPEGFRGETTTFGQCYKGDFYEGVIVASGKRDSNYIRFTPANQQLEKTGSENYRTSVITWLTEDPFPLTL